MTEHAFLTAPEVADYLRITVHTVRVMIRDGRLKGVKVGKGYRISKRSFDAYLDAVENGDVKEALNETYRGQA